MISVVLAAGNASRFGSSKQLHKVKGKPMIRHVLDSVQAYEDVFKVNTNDHNHSKIGIVIGAFEQEMRNYLNADERVDLIINKNFDQGLSSSVCEAVKYAREKKQDLLVTLADLPFVTKDDYISLRKKFDSKPIFSKFGGTFGPPCIIPRKHLDMLTAFSGDKGLKTKFQKFDTVEISNASKDIDTLADLKREFQE